MSVDAYVVCDDAKAYAYLGKLGAGGFHYGNLVDPQAKKTGSFIGQWLGRSIKIVRCEDIPSDYQQWKDET